MAKKKHSDIPWLNVVRFHKEIVERNEDSFFSLRAAQDQDERWSSLIGFELERDTGPWEVSTNSVMSKKFLSSILPKEQQSVYLGGPCCFHQIWENKKQKPRWRPLLYREVKLSEKDNATLLIEPQYDSWNFAPWFFRLFERLTIPPPAPPDSFDQVLSEMLASTAKIAARNRGIFQFLYTRYPPLDGELERLIPQNTFPSTPTDWVLFAPTNTFSPFVRNLHQDYVELEALLEEDETNIGGLEILEKLPEQKLPEKEVMPFIEINRMQEESIKQILQKWPITVISGPPGTGKSQVVVSLLLNAWKRAIPVLFTSNNNNAVDVVKERISRFDDYPIAVRAGARAQQNINKVLASVLILANQVTNGILPVPEGDEKPAEKKAHKELKDRLKELDSLRKNFLLISEARKAFLNALSASWKHEEKLTTLVNEFAGKKEMLGLGKLKTKTTRTAVQDTRKWLEKEAEHRQLAEENQKEVEACNQKISKAEDLRNKAAGDVGFTPTESDSWNWLSELTPTIDGLKTWEKETIKRLGKTNKALTEFEWNETFDHWDSAEDCEEWGLRAQHFLEEAKTELDKLDTKLQKVRELDDSRKKAARDIKELGIDEDSSLSLELLESWAAAYAEFTSLTEAQKKSWLPFSKASKLSNAMRDIEGKLREEFPLEIWTKIGTLNEDGRKQLAAVVETAIRWIKLDKKWSVSEPERDEIKNGFKRIGKLAKDLKLKDIPRVQKTDNWEPLFTSCEELAANAEAAKAAWKKRGAREKAQEELKVVAEKFLGFYEDIPLVESWCKRDGKDLYQSIKSLRNSPSSESAANAKTKITGDTLSTLTEALKSTKKHSEVIAKLREEKKGIPSVDSHINQWWSEMPRNAEHFSGIVERPTEWPQMNSATARISEIESWCKEYEDFLSEDGEKLEIESAKKGEVNRAKEKVKNVLGYLPSGKEKTEITKLFSKIWNKTNEEQTKLIGKIENILQDFTPERAEAEKKSIDKRLALAAFEDAKLIFNGRLDTEPKAVAAIAKLATALAKGALAKKDYRAFKESMSLIPVWITTAQSPQAIPLEPGVFDIVVIDEATQCTFTNLLPLMYRGKTLAVIGDDKQLPAIPTITETEELQLAAKHGITDHLELVGHATNNVYLSATKALPRGPADIVMLTEHFRSHPLIIGFSNRYIYQRALILKKNPNVDFTDEAGVFPIDTNGISERGPKGNSWVNRIEAEKVRDLVMSLMKKAGTGKGLSVGIVTPFRPQKDLIQKLIDGLGLKTNILVDTAHGFQGDERDVMIFSPVVSPGATPGLTKLMNSSAQWVESPPNVTNVALTRAKEALYIVADFNYLRSRKPDSILFLLAEYCDNIEELRNLGEGRVDLYSWLVVQGWAPEVLPPGLEGVDFVLEDKGNGIRLAILVTGPGIQKDPVKELDLRGQGLKVEWVSTRDILATPYNVIEKIKDALG